MHTIKTRHFESIGDDVRLLVDLTRAFISTMTAAAFSKTKL